jgi:hypothetical protein
VILCFHIVMFWAVSFLHDSIACWVWICSSHLLCYVQLSLNPSTLHIVLLREPGDFTYTFYWVSGSTLNIVLCYTCALSVCVFCIRSHDLSFPSLIGRYSHIVLYSYGMYNCHHGNTNPSHFDSGLLGVFLFAWSLQDVIWIWVGIDISSKCLLFFFPY